MKECPQCGKKENEITMETGAEKAADNRVWCPCGFTGKYGDLKGDGKKTAESAPEEKKEPAEPVKEPEEGDGKKAAKGKTAK